MSRSVFDGVRRLLFVDPRRFGTGELVAGDAALAAFYAARLGVEPFDEAFTAAALRALARGRRAPIKPFLLDQRRVAGVGNIYADEALFRAGVHPLRPAGSLRPVQYARLRDGVREALAAGIEARGASIDDYRDPDGVRGSFQDRFLVHLREGEPCVVCGTPIRKLVVGGRGTYVCTRCQPVPRPRRGGRGCAQAASSSARRPERSAASELHEAADELVADDDLRERHHPCTRRELGAPVGVHREVDLVVVEAALGEQRLRLAAVAARLSGIDA